MNEGAWSEPKGFPKTRSAAPAQIELNGRRIFAKGSNWVCPELFPGTVGEERCKELIDIAVATNFNILRSWGGGIVNKDCFFEYCDRRGILVWQEFPLACNCYPDDPHYLATLEQEATAIIRRLRRHPSLAIWCGGNELFNNWSGMTDQSLALRLLNALCYRLSPEIPFNATSPLNGMAHGNYLFYWEGRDIFQLINDSHFTAYTEFGVPGISPREVLEKIIPPEELFPPRPGTAWEEHHAFGAWDGSPATWLGEPTIERYFGRAQTLDQLIERSSLMQGEGYKAVFEEARRQKPYQEKTMPLTPESMDAIALFFTMRGSDADSFKPGEPATLQMVLQDTIRHLSYRFINRETKKIRNMGKFKTLKFECQLGTTEGFSFTDGTVFTLWISDDENKIPLYIESPVRVGSINAYISGYKGLKYPMTSLIK